jgi:hypothetical protein
MSELVERIADFIEIRGNIYDERRLEQPWAGILERWRATYEAGKRKPLSSFSLATREANVEALTALIALAPINPERGGR